MPYIQTGAPQSQTGNPGISDVYHSGNVYANNVAVALWLAPGASATFVGSYPSPTLSFPNAETVAASAAVVDSYVANPSQFYNASAEADGVKANYAGTPDDGTTSTGVISPSPTSADIVPFLQKCLEEAGRGMWRETGQGGKPSNPNITNIWKDLAYPSAGMWTTDQTAWCMGFVNYALKSSGYRYVQTASARALPDNPGRWNATPIPKEQAQPGDIAFWSYRHVNFVYTAANGKFSFCGGNQTPKGGKNNPDDGEITNSYPGGTSASNPNWVSCWRPSRT